MSDKERTEELVVVDISRYKKVKNALKDSEARYRLLFENMSLGVFRITADRKIIDANPALLKMFEYSSFSEIEHWQSEKNSHKFLETWRGLCDRIDQQGDGGGFDLTWRKKDNTPLFIHVNAKVISESDGKVLFYEGTIEDISERKQTETQTEAAFEALQVSLAEKNVLLKEVHHRVKNNLMTIIGLIKMQETKANNEMFSPLLQELEGRISAMALVHENLHKSKDLAHVNLQNYIETMSDQIHAQFGADRDIRFRVQAAGVDVDLNIAVPCGLILNELITNAYKHAFPGDKPHAGESYCEINVAMEQAGGAFTLTVADNGVGLPAGLDWERSETLGLRLIKMLSQQINGSMGLDRSAGTVFRLKFPMAV